MPIASSAGTERRRHCYAHMNSHVGCLCNERADCLGSPHAAQALGIARRSWLVMQAHRQCAWVVALLAMQPLQRLPEVGNAVLVTASAVAALHLAIALSVRALGRTCRHQQSRCRRLALVIAPTWAQGEVPDAGKAPLLINKPHVMFVIDGCCKCPAWRHSANVFFINAHAAPARQVRG